MSEQINLAKYEEFVKSVVSQPSSDFGTMIERMYALQHNPYGIPVPELLTSAVGLSSESGEFSEIVKKLFFHGKELNEEVIVHMQKELGDICWYLVVASYAVGVNLDTIIRMNIEKLSARYPAGFEILRSEVRAAGDI